MTTSRDTATRQQLIATAEALHDHVLLRRGEQDRLEQIRRSLHRHNTVVETADIIADLTGLRQVLETRAHGHAGDASEQERRKPRRASGECPGAASSKRATGHDDNRPATQGNAADTTHYAAAGEEDHGVGPGQGGEGHTGRVDGPPLLEAAVLASRKRVRDLHRLLGVLFSSVILTAFVTLVLLSRTVSLPLAGLIAGTGLVAIIGQLVASMVALLPYQTAVASADYMNQTAAAFAVIATGKHGEADLAAALIPDARAYAATVLTADDIPKVLRMLITLTEKFAPNRSSHTSDTASPESATPPSGATTPPGESPEGDTA